MRVTTTDATRTREIKCTKCKGSGYVAVNNFVSTTGHLVDEEVCPVCNGTGHVEIPVETV